MIRPGITVQLMVRNEELTIWESIMSTVPYADAAVIVDTGSTDRTRELIDDAVRRISGVPIIVRDVTSPEQSSWTLRAGSSPHPSRDLGDVRNLMRDLSETEWLWTVDADEIYFPKAADFIGRRYWKTIIPAIECVYVPMMWMGHDPDKQADVAYPPTYPVTGRLFRNNFFYTHANRGLEEKWEVYFPGEAAHYFNPKTKSWSVPYPGRPNCLGISEADMQPVMHYEMSSKPWRRVCEADRPALLAQNRPPIFEWSRRLFGGNIFTAFAQGKIPAQPS
jgi:hypothetical protein